MHHEHGCVWGNCVDLIERWHPAFCELEFGPTSDHPYPLRRGSSCSLFFQHPQCIGQRRDTIPAQFQVVVEPAPDRSEEHTSELQSPCKLVCRLLLEKKKWHRRSSVLITQKAPN